MPSRRSVLVLAFAALSACAAPLPPGAVMGLAQVERIEIEGVPPHSVTATAIIEGVLPDACTQIGPVHQTVFESRIDIEITTWRPPDTVCAAVVRDFRLLVMLDTKAFESNLYVVYANGVRATYLALVDPIEELILGPNR